MMKSKVIAVKKEDYDVTRRKNYERWIDTILSCKTLIEDQRKVLNEYHRSIKLNSRVRSIGTVFNYLRHIRLLGEFRKKPFNEFTREDIEEYILYQQRKDKPNNANQINQTMIFIKAFFKWLYQTDTYPDIVKWMKPKLKPNKLRYEELITWEETFDLMKFCFTARDRCILALIRDIGGRVEETILRPKIKDLIKDDYGFKIRLVGKTSERTVRLTKSVPFMVEWLNNHPFKNEPEAPLFCVISLRKFKIGNDKIKKFGNPLGYQSVLSFFKELKQRSGIKKPLHAHVFRHASATDRALQGFQEKELRVIYGWSGNSRMVDLYCNFDSQQVDEKILEKDGKIVKKDNKAVIVNAIICPQCSKENIPTNLYCSICNTDLQKKSITEETNKTIQLLLEIAKNPELMKQLEEFRKQKQ